MEFSRGERVNLNFDTGAVEKLEPDENYDSSAAAFPTFVGDILERESSHATAPVAPSLKANVNGFPAHKKRIPRVSAFKLRRAAKEQQAATAPQPSAQNAPEVRSVGADPNDEKKAIDEENKQRLAAMSDAEIDRERKELMSSLSPALIQKLLGRSNIDEGSNERDLFPVDADVPPATDDTKAEPITKSSNTKKVSFAVREPADEAAQEGTTSTPNITRKTLQDTRRDTPQEPPLNTLHFPTPTQPPNLDPNDPSFLSDLHNKYFPNLPYDPSSLSWMSPIDPNDTSSPYHPSQTALNASELRFDFKGTLLAPSVARSIPSDRGLHNHAAAPEAAGYTIPELSVLSRSAVPAQRCMAYQTLGRILYRLGTGEFGVEKGSKDVGPVRVMQNPNTQESDEEEDEEEDVGSAMAAGLWACMETGRVIDTLTEEAGREKGHLTARTFAQEALWNWRRGGGRRRMAV